MAELGALASIIGIAATGAQISMTLYSLSTTLSSARKDITRVATNIATFCSALQQLGSTLEKARAARFSISAIATTQEILDRCQELFEEIKDVVEKLKGPQNEYEGEGKEMDVKARVRWVFKRGRVQRLQAELESMKLTLNLMLMTLNFAQRVEMRRQSRIIPTEEVQNEDEEINTIATNLLIAQQCVEDELDDLEALEDESKNGWVAVQTDEVQSQSTLIDFPTIPQPRHSYRASLWLGDPLSQIDPSCIDSHSPSENRKIFENLLKRWVNSDISETLEGPSFSKERTSPKTRPPNVLPFREPIVVPPHGPAPVRAYIKQELEKFKRNNDEENKVVFTLDMSARLLGAVPMEVVDLAGDELVRLAMSDNKLRMFNVPVGAFPHLQYLNLRSNKLETIDMITTITTLEVLDLSKNRIKSLPSSLENLKLLKVLAIARNQIAEPPFVLGGMESLQVINVEDNPFLEFNGYSEVLHGADGNKNDDTSIVTIELKKKLLEDKAKGFIEGGENAPVDPETVKSYI